MRVCQRLEKSGKQYTFYILLCHNLLRTLKRRASQRLFILIHVECQLAALDVTGARRSDIGIRREHQRTDIVNRQSSARVRPPHWCPSHNLGDASPAPRGPFHTYPRDFIWCGQYQSRRIMRTSCHPSRSRRTSPLCANEVSGLYKSAYRNGFGHLTENWFDNWSTQ